MLKSEIGIDIKNIKDELLDEYKVEYVNEINYTKYFSVRNFRSGSALNF
jgi:hypothetical protein